MTARKIKQRARAAKPATPPAPKPSVSGRTLVDAVLRGEQPCPPPGQVLYAVSVVSQMKAETSVTELPEFPVRELTEKERALVRWFMDRSLRGLPPPRRPEALRKAKELGLSGNSLDCIREFLPPGLKHTTPGKPKKTPEII